MANSKLSNSKPQIKHCAGKENFERMNYLYQISALYAKEGNDTMKLFSRQCSNLMTNISKKAVLRIEPKIKRKICKLCKMVLIPEETCTVRVKKKKVRWTCKTCKSNKDFSTNREYGCWIDNPESLLEKLDYSDNCNRYK